MKLSKILKSLRILTEVKNHKVTGIYNNSKECTYNSIFIALGGINNDGNNFIDEAIRNGAKTIITEKDIKKEVNVIRVNNIKEIQAKVAKVFYKDLSSKIKIIGVTGTNGKTSVTTLLHNFLKQWGSVLIGTNGVFINDEFHSLSNTTPDILTTYKFLKEAVTRHFRFAVMEVSSIGISEYRVHGLAFEYTIYTNISHDHLDYHKTTQNYIEAKRKLLIQTKRHNLINKDDHILYNFRDFRSIFYSLNEVEVLSEEPLIFKFNDSKYYSRLYGKFNVYNIMACIKILSLMGINLMKFKEYLKDFKKIDGRMNVYSVQDKKIVIDYAHSPGAVKNVLETFKGCVVIGCGGDRDILKRKVIAEICLDKAEFSVFTSDNPRTESLYKIFNDMTFGLKGDYLIIPDRYSAIEYAIKNFNTILILGKGNEEFQVVGNKKIRFSDLKAVKRILKE
ncbi:UDP-N-acetylmuramoyl-L-alanyl-D-glutamate--2,6-diaminopimelate ligase [Mycoplasmatota bacterium zrk1]